MKIIRTITEKDFGRQENPNLWSTFNIRPSARAVLVDDNGRIALMYVKNYNYYKLPGGGLDKGETIEAGLKRELLEEVGAKSFEVITEIGQINEYRERSHQKSEHYAFIAKLTGDVTDPQRTEKEITHGYCTVWADSVDEAIELVKSGMPSEYGQDFERLRELAFLEYVKNYMPII